MHVFRRGESKFQSSVLCSLQQALTINKVICWQQDTTTEYYLVTADHLIKYLGGFEEEVSLMSLRNGIQGAQSNVLSADLPRFEETSVCGIKSSWKIKEVEGKEDRRREEELLTIGNTVTT